MYNELAVLKDRMDGLEILVHDLLQAARSVNTEDFQTQLADMRAQFAKLAEKPVQSIDGLYGELLKSKSGKRKKKAGESDDELPVDLPKEERRQEKNARKASKKAVREKEALAQQHRYGKVVLLVAEHLL
uniref:Uncharacterized protein n=1 Tax=Solanum tuberosum TaxID=4113 RepID=M1DBH5_SOLTU